MEEPEQPPKKSTLDSCLITFAVLFFLGLVGFILMIENIKYQLSMH
jgi:preprotein translocase subunit Sss1